MEGEELEDVAVMRTAIQSFVDCIGILGYDNNSGGGVAALMESHVQLTQLDKRCLQYPWVTPSISEVEEIVNVARKKDRGGGASEDDWNTEVHLQLLKLAHKTSTHRTLDIHNVKSARIEPPSLAGSRLPGRIVHYVIALNPDAITHAWRTVQVLESYDKTAITLSPSILKLKGR